MKQGSYLAALFDSVLFVKQSTRILYFIQIDLQGVTHS
jgi:hypothetical protein